MNTAAAMKDSDPFETVMAEARRRGLGVADMMRLEALKWEFLARADPDRHHEFPRYASAILFRTHGERLNFIAPPGSGMAPTTAPARLATFVVEPQTVTLADWAKARAPGLAMVAIAATLAIVALRYVLKRWGAGDTQGDTGPTQMPSDAPVPPPTVAPTVSPTTRLVFEPNAVWWAIAVTLLIAAAAYLAWHHYRRRRLRREANENGQPLGKIAVQLGRNTLFADPELRGVLRNLRRYRSVVSDRIDMLASLRATVARAGLPTIRFGRRPLAPEYILVSDREAPNDHLPELAEALSERLDRAHLFSTRYEFFGEPSELRRASGREADRFEPIEAVISRHEGATMMVMMESADALPSPLRLPRWLETAAQRVRAVLVNPRERRHWSEEERMLQALGLKCFPGTIAGLADLADHLSQDTGDGASRILASPEPDLASYLAKHRTMLLSPTAPDDARIAAIVANLERWLDAGAMDWLRTIALFPVITTGFTFFAGATLAEQTLISHTRFLAIARLPWLRTGQMPDWLRQALVRGFSPDRLDRATAVIQAYLMPPRGEVASRPDFLQLRARAEQPAERRRLIARLAAMDNPLSEDTLMLGALHGVSPSELEAELDAATLPSAAWHRKPEARVGLGLLAGLALLSALVPPLVFRDSPPPSIKPSDGPTASQTAQAATSAAETLAEPATTAASDGIPVATDSGGSTAGVVGNRFYIQVGSDADMALARRVNASLAGFQINGMPLQIAAVQRVSNSPRVNQLRCFQPDTCASADALRQAIAAAGVSANVVPFRANDFVWRAPKRPDQYELWIAPAGSGGKAGNSAKSPEPAPTQIATPTSTPISKLLNCSRVGSDELTTDLIDARLAELVQETKDRRIARLLVAGPPPTISSIAFTNADMVPQAGNDLRQCRNYIDKQLGYYFKGVPIVTEGTFENTRLGPALRVTVVYAQAGA